MIGKLLGGKRDPPQASPVDRLFYDLRRDANWPSAAVAIDAFDDGAGSVEYLQFGLTGQKPDMIAAGEKQPDAPLHRRNGVNAKVVALQRSHFTQPTA